MRICFKRPLLLGLGSGLLVAAWGALAAQDGTAGAIQAIQQAPDPSAAVAAFASGVAIDRNDPKLYEAYVNRMVDLGLPEMAYHQAQTLNTLDTRDGLAWGVQAYVDARRGNLPEAISAINLAGQFAPDNKFVQRTAGEIAAWYDTKGSTITLPQAAKDGLAKVRSSMASSPAFTAAYQTARQAYTSQAGTASPPVQAAPEAVAPGTQAAPEAYDYAVAPPPVVYYPDYTAGYYYDYGPTWIEPAPWWWWQPIGFFGGCDFFPFGAFVVFDHDHFHHHHDFDHDRDDHVFHRDNPAFWHGGTGSRANFFGMPARPAPAITAAVRSSFQVSSQTAVISRGFNSTAPATERPISPVLSSPKFAASELRGTPMPTRSANEAFFAPPSSSWSGVPHGGAWAGPGFHAARSPGAPIAHGSAMPQGGARSAPSAGSGGGFHGGSSMGGGGSHGTGGFSGGGGFGGGGHGR